MKINSGPIKNLHKRFQDRDLQPPVFILSCCKNYFCQTLRRVRKNVKKLIFHVLRERPFSMQKPKMNMFLHLKKLRRAAWGASLTRGPVPRAASQPADSNLKPRTELSGFSPRADGSLMLATPNYIRHLILNLRYFNVKPYHSNSHKAVRHSTAQNGCSLSSPRNLTRTSCFVVLHTTKWSI